METLPELCCLREYVVGQLIYSRGMETRLFLAKRNSEDFVLKIYTQERWISREKHVVEGVINCQLRHPSICPAEAFYLEEAGTLFYLVIVERRMDTDLQEEAKVRFRDGRPWTEAELNLAFQQLISGFAHAQRASIAHRDVKPANLYLHQGQFLIGDFGSAKIYEFGYKGGVLMQSFVGSQQFLSPELYKRLPEVQASACIHSNYDAYRSDVYSLALSLIYLVFPNKTDVFHVNSEVNLLVERLPGAAINKELMHSMLGLRPETRPDFIELENALNYAKFQANLTDFSQISSISVKNSSETDTNFSFPTKSSKFPFIPVKYSQKRSLLTCIICAKPTPMRKFPCFLHSICSDPCSQRLEMLISRGFLGRSECLICKGSSWSSEIDRLTVSLVAISRCHYCGLQPVSMESMLYLICGGSLRVICSKRCVKSLYNRWKEGKEEVCRHCKVRLREEDLRNALLARSYRDMPVVPSLQPG